MSGDHSTVKYRIVDGYPGYRVGTDGSVWTRMKPVQSGYVVGTQWRQLKCKRVNPWGHRGVCLAGGRYRLVHHLVLEAFVGPRPAGMECCHYDGDPTNNRLANLRWDTSKANKADTKRHGRARIGTMVPSAKLTEKQVQQIRCEYVRGIVGCIRLGKRYGVSEASIRRVLTGQCWSHVQ